MDLAEIIKALEIRYGLTIADLATICECDEDTFLEIRAGDKPATEKQKFHLKLTHSTLVARN